MRGQPTISTIYSRGPTETPPEVQRQNAADAKRRAWHDHGLLVLDPEDINNDLDRQHAINLGNQFYGRRGGRG